MQTSRHSNDSEKHGKFICDCAAAGSTLRWGFSLMKAQG
jgi:hypothetical protein